MKRLTGILLAMVLLLCACGGETVKVRAGVTAEEMGQAVESAIAARADLVVMTQEYIDGVMSLDTADCEEVRVTVSSDGGSINEYGVFRMADEAAAKAFAQKVTDYLNGRVQSWQPEYLPEQFPNLQKAKAETVGNYVLYTILSDSERAAASEAFSQLLTEE